MASIEELYKKSAASKVPSKKDRTPISAEDFSASELAVTESTLEKARGGKLNLKKYSDSIKR